jgi:hypothetical protein
MSEPTALERSLAELLGKFRRAEVEPLKRRIEALEHALAIEQRLARLEQRAGIDHPGERLILPEHWLNGSGRG